jgi:AcrR family transcriptional regulator
MHNVVKKDLKNINNNMRYSIINTAKRLFLKQGYQKTTIRQIVKEANTSTGNFYFYFPDKLSLLNIIAQEFIMILRNLTDKVKTLNLSPEVAFAYDFRLGYIKTLEDQRLSQLWHIIKTTPEVNLKSLENKRNRLVKFFGHQFPEQKLRLLAVAIQGISDSITQQKRDGVLCEDAIVLSNIIVEYSLCLLGYSSEQIKTTLEKIDELIKKNKDMLKDLEEYLTFNSDMIHDKKTLLKS